MTDKNRNFIAQNQEINAWSDVEPYLENLKNRTLNSVSDLHQWWADRSEIEAFLEENAAWRYIRMTCDTTDKSLSDSFNFFVTEIEPRAAEYADVLDKKLLENPFLAELDTKKYFVPLRSMKRAVEIFRAENIPIFAELQQLQQQFGAISGAMTIEVEGKTLTLQQAANYLKNTDREIRKNVYEKIGQRRAQDELTLNDLLSGLIEKRHKVALNAGFENFRDYQFSALKRFDYTVADNFEFHNSIKETVLPLVEKMAQKRKTELGYDSLKPYDLQVDTSGKPALKPFETGEELLEKSIRVFTKIRPQYGAYLETMKLENYLDLDSRIGKAPGGYNYPLYESNIPFIFMNAAGNVRDLETMMHEGGHAVHSFLSSDLELVDFKSLPSEVAELASMSMELISMDYRDEFFENPDDTRRAKRAQLEGAIETLTWVAIVDKFQHKLYTNPTHTVAEREQMWLDVLNEFSEKITDWSGFENFRKIMWQKQLHIFEVPFYYVEYAIAQLGAIAVWRNYKQNQEKGLNAYESALKLGYSKPIPEIYETAGIRFDFSKNYIGELMEFVWQELEKL